MHFPTQIRFPPCTLKTRLITTATFLCARKFEQFPLLYPLPKTTQIEIGKGIQYSLQLSIPLFPTKDLYKNDKEASHHSTAGFKHNRLFVSAIFWEFLTGGTLLFPYLPLFRDISKSQCFRICNTKTGVNYPPPGHVAQQAEQRTPCCSSDTKTFSNHP